MRQSSSLLALVAVAAACSSPDPIANTDSGGVTGGTGGMLSLDTSATTAPTTSGATTAGATTTAPSLPTTTDSASSSTSSGDHTTTFTSSTTLPVDTTGTVDVTTTTGGESTTTATTGPEPVETWTPKDCPAIFAQDLLPTFEIEISKSELSKLKSEWKAADEDKTTEHPLESFKFGDNVVTTATARLRGNAKWWSGQGDKMQLQISFNTFDKKARFLGLRKLLFDAAEFNKSFLRDRLSMAVFRDVGLPAPCANNARVVINGEYHGLFTSIEKVDKELLERYFEDPEGNLYKNGGDWEKKTNEANLDMTDLEALLDVKSIADLDAAMNLDEAILEWAAEAVLPDGDGAWAGGLNFYLYNDPKAGFNVIPWDKDATFTRLDFDTDPYAYLKPGDHGRPFYDIATADPVWFDKYIEAVAHVLEHGYKVEVLQARIDAWSAQIATAAGEDSNKPFPTSEHLVAVQEKRAFVAQRHAYLKAWLACWQNGGKKKGKKCSPP